jgi:hypothetical protein
MPTLEIPSSRDIVVFELQEVLQARHKVFTQRLAEQ